MMRTAELVGCHRRRRVGLTRRDPKAAPIPDLVARQFRAAEPDATWTADITQIPTGEGWLYLAVVLDVFSRRIVGWAMAEHMRTELVIDALVMAIRQRQPKVGVIHHSDQGSPVHLDQLRSTRPRRRRPTLRRRGRLLLR